MAPCKSGLLLLCSLLLLESGLSRPSSASDEGYAQEYPNDDDGDSLNDSDYGDDGDGDVPYAGPLPEFTAGRELAELHPGENVSFPCAWRIPNANATKAPKFVTIWKKGDNALVMDNIKMTVDPRISSTEDGSLVVTDVRPSDRGNYTCEVVVEDKTLDLRHTLEIYEAPSELQIYPNEPSLIVNAGDPLTLTCEVKGYPLPTITWMKKKKGQEESLAGSTIIVEKVAPKNSGMYECHAANFLGRADPAHIRVHVHFPPKVSAIKKHVTVGVDYEAEMECKVDSEPTAKVEWLKSGKHIKQSDNVEISHSSHIHKLRIHKTAVEDLGNYTCKATNELGTAQATVHLSQAPSKPTLRDSKHSEDGKSVFLEWSLESYAPISEYRLQYRNKMTDEWKTENPEVTNAEGNIYTVKHKLSPQPVAEGEYEVVLVSTNQFGESKSEPHTFQLPHELGKAEPQGVQNLPQAEQPSGVGDSRPRLAALCTVLGLSVLFLW